MSEKAQFDSHEEHVRLPWHRKFAYGMGSFGAPLLVDANGQLQVFYTAILGLDPRFAGWALSAAMLFDAVSDPVMGQISDNTRSRWGRRRPYILIGGLFCSLTFTFLWLVPESLSGWSAFAYLLVGLILFHAASTVTLIPYTALGTELSTDYDERTRIFAWQKAIQTISSVLLLPMWWVAHWGVFGSPRIGFGVFAGALALIAFIGFIWVFFGTREEAGVQQQAAMPFLPAFRATLSNVVFWLLALSFLLLMLGVLAFVNFSSYVNIYYVFNGDTAKASEVMAAMGGVRFVIEFLGVFVAAKMGLWFGKRNAFIVCLAVFGIAPMTSWYLFTPEHPWLQLVMSVLISPIVVGLVLFPYAMLADVIDTDEYRTGRRREGSFSSVFGFLGKAAGAVAMLLIGYVLTWVGFDESAMQQPEEAILRLRVLAAFGPAVIVVFAFPLLLLYPLNEKRVRKLRRVLDARRSRQVLSSAAQG